MSPMEPINAFLACETPDAWIEEALKHQDILLIDHANCEKKAAATALNLMFRYVDRADLLERMSRLAREELRHFEQVLKIIQKRGIKYVHVSAARYAEGLRKGMRKRDPEKLVDVLIIGAYIEARSCERFHRLAPFLDEELEQFYRSLLASEARHFKHYLELAKRYAAGPIDERVAYFGRLEADLILSEDESFRFHSGVPARTVSASE